MKHLYITLLRSLFLRALINQSQLKYTDSALAETHPGSRTFITSLSIIDNIPNQVPAETVETEIDPVVIFLHKLSLCMFSGTPVKVINLKSFTEAE